METHITEGVTRPGARPPSSLAVDLDPARRPGVPKERSPQAWPNTRWPLARQQGEPAVPRHGRPGKPFPPVYGTAVPPHGLSGAIRRAAYKLPDHVVRHWVMLLFADRVDSWEHRTLARRALAVGAPLAALWLVGRRALAR